MIDRILSECFSPVSPHAIDRYSDSPRVRGIYAAVVESFPDATFTPQWSVADDRRVALGGLVAATHRGEWRGVSPTGRRIDVLATVMLELADNGVVDLMVVTDSLALAEQVGAVEELGPKACATLPPSGRVFDTSGRTACGDAMFGGGPDLQRRVPRHAP
jgi:predicted ester cyclase